MSHAHVRLLMLVVVVIAAVSLATTGDRVNWILEECVVLIAIPCVLHFSRRAGLTTTLVVAITLQMLVITQGAHSTYEHAILGTWIEHLFDMHRNPWDRVGHLFQGIVPALTAWEVLRRYVKLRPSPLLRYLAISVAMGISAVYEIIEMILGLIGADATRAFVNTNGDILDPQWDMTMALIGSMLAVLCLSRWQERKLRVLA